MSRRIFLPLYPGLKKRLAWYIINSLCRCVGTGRRGGLKIHCQQWRAGSIPATGTTASGQSALRSVSGRQPKADAENCTPLPCPSFQNRNHDVGLRFCVLGASVLLRLFFLSNPKLGLRICVFFARFASLPCLSVGNCGLWVDFWGVALYNVFDINSERRGS